MLVVGLLLLILRSGFRFQVEIRRREKVVGKIRSGLEICRRIFEKRILILEVLVDKVGVDEAVAGVDAGIAAVERGKTS